MNCTIGSIVTGGGGGGGITWATPVNAVITPDGNLTRNLGTGAARFNVGYLGSIELGSSGAYIFVEDSGSANYGQIWTTGTPQNIGGQTSVGAVVEFGNGINGGIYTYDGGSLEVLTRDDGAGSGVLYLTTGDSGASNSGSIILQVGSSSATQGVFKFLKNGVAPTPGDVWTASNADGTGYWAAPGGGVSYNSIASLVGPNALGGSGTLYALSFTSHSESGSDISYTADSGSDSDLWTINTTGWYEIRAFGYSTSETINLNAGITVGDNGSGNGLESIMGSAIAFTSSIYDSSANSATVDVTANVYLTSGDVLRFVESSGATFESGNWSSLTVTIKRIPPPQG